jgi:hypothetical protein
LDGFEDDERAFWNRLLAESAGVEPGAELDASILAAAHRAVAAGPTSLEQSAPRSGQVLRRRWTVPVGIAASVVLTASIGVALWQERPEVFTNPSQPVTQSVTQPVTPPVPAPSLDATGRERAIPEPLARQPIDASDQSAKKLDAPKALAARQASSATASSQPSKKAAAPSPFPGAPQAAHAPGSPLAGRDETIERALVTGQNLRRADTETPSPVQVFTPGDIAGSGPGQSAAVTSASPPSNAASAIAPLGSAAPEAVPPVAPAPPVLAPAPPMSFAPMSPAPAMPAAPIPPAPALQAAPPAAAPPRALVPAAPRAAAPNVTPDAALATLAQSDERADQQILRDLEKSVAAGDAAATRLLLHRLYRVAPQAHLSDALRAAILRLGVDPSPPDPEAPKQ